MKYGYGNDQASNSQVDSLRVAMAMIVDLADDPINKYRVHAKLERGPRTRNMC